MDGNITRLKVKDVVDAKFHHIFSHEYFNYMQSLVFEQAYSTDKNMTIASPTGSGKTVIHELALLRLLYRMDQTGKCRKYLKALYIG